MNRALNAKESFKRFLANHCLDDCLQLSQAIESCFHLSAEDDLAQHTKIILNELFNQITSQTFHFQNTLAKFELLKNTEDNFLKTFLYGLYFGDIDLTDYHEQDAEKIYEFLMLQILSEITPKEELYEILKKYLHAHDFSFIYFLNLHYREGSQIILNWIEKTSSSHSVDKLIINLKRKYYDVNSLKKLLNEEKKEEAIIAFLEQESYEEVKQFRDVLYALVALMISSSTRVYETLKNKKTLVDVTEDMQSISESRQHNLFKLFNPFLEKPFSNDEFLEFFRLFGLYGDYPFLEWDELEINNSLTQKIEAIHALFSDPLRIIQSDRALLNIYMAFIKNVLDELEAFHRIPEKYAQGLQNTVFVIPTKDKLLESQAAFPAFFKSQKILLEYLNSHLPKPFKAADYPLIVLDQSDNNLFAENKKYLIYLEKELEVRIIHVSKQEALQHADKEHVDKLIDTTGTGIFGYGGMRNCVFFLAPLISNPTATFCDTILGGKNYPHGIGILMLDDDNAIPESNLFCHMHFASNSKDRYTSLACFNTGRYSKMIMYPVLSQLLDNPQEAWVYARWVDDHFSSTMSEYYSNPKICINLPFGGEEGHLDILYENYPLLRCSLHLSGPRFPIKKFPTRAFVGLEEKLDGYIRYALNTGLTGWLLDPLDTKNRCALPWNKSPLKLNDVTCLRDVLNYMMSEEIKEEMEMRFWNNLADLYSEKTFPKMRLKEWIEDLLNMNIPLILQKYEQKQSLNLSEKDSLEKIGRIYSFYQQDAKYFWEYGSKVLNDKYNYNEIRLEMENRYKINFTDYPFTEGLYLIIKNVGLGAFLEDLKAIRSQDSRPHQIH